METWADGTRHEGNFVDGKASGKGIRTYSDGDSYDGEFLFG